MEGMAGYALPTRRTAPVVSMQSRRAPLTSSQMFGNPNVPVIASVTMTQPCAPVVTPMVAGTSKSWTTTQTAAMPRASTRVIPKAPVQPSATGSKTTTMKKGK